MEKRICIPYPLKFDKGTAIVPFGGNTYHVGVDTKEVEGEHLSVHDLFKYLQLKGFDKKFIFNGEEYVKGDILVKLTKQSSTFDIMSEDVLLKVPLRSLTLTDTGLVAKVVNTCIQIV